MGYRDMMNVSVNLLGEVVEGKGVLTARSWQDLTGPRKILINLIRDVRLLVERLSLPVSVIAGKDP